MNTIKKTIDLLNKSYSPYHVVKNIEEELKRKDFTLLSEEENYELTPGNKYYVKRNDSSIIAFKLPKDMSDFHFQITASHTDSPTFKIKPDPVIRKETAILLNTEPYGGLIHNTWLDKPLSFAGRVMVSQNGRKIQTKLLAIDEDLLIIPNLCIHMNREINSGFKYNPSKDLLPIFALDERDDFSFDSYLLEKLNLDKSYEIKGYDLFLYNRQKPTVIGKNQELLGSPREDDLASCYSALLGFLDSKNTDDTVSVFVAFDNEEVGSLTKQGANSTFLKETLKRISKIFKHADDDFEKEIAKSCLISIDNAHADHPNYLEIKDKTTSILMNHGIVIKYNANQSYTSDSFSSAIVKLICDNYDIHYQDYTNRSDMRGGSTLGNISNSMVSLTSVDIGIGQLSMHSSYEVMGKYDLEAMKAFVELFYSSNIKITSNSIELK